MQLSELVSEGQTFAQLNFDYNNYQTYGPEEISLLQYLLSILSQFYTTIPFVNIDGIYGEQTRQAVRALQQDAGLPQTGVVDFDTWEAIYDQFSGIETTTWRNPESFPYTSAILGNSNPRARYSATSTMSQFPGGNLSSGQQDPVRQEAPR